MINRIAEMLETDLGLGGISILLLAIVGYIGYGVAYSGLKTKDKPFKIAIFSLPFLVLTLVWKEPICICLVPIENNLLTITIVAIIFSFLMGIIWRNWLRTGIHKVLVSLKVSTEDGYDNIYDQFNTRIDLQVEMITVTLNDGTKLRGRLRIETGGINQGIIDQYGNLGLYVEQKEVNGELTGVRYEEDRIYKYTCIPSSSIKLIEYSYSQV